MSYASESRYGGASSIERIPIACSDVNRSSFDGESLPDADHPAGERVLEGRHRGRREPARRARHLVEEQPARTVVEGDVGNGGCAVADRERAHATSLASGPVRSTLRESLVDDRVGGHRRGA